MSTQAPVTFLINNTINDWTGMPCPPAPPPPNNRVGAAFYNNWLLFATPRLNESNGNYYLDLQYNHVETNGTAITSVDTGVSCGVRPNTEALPIRIMARMETFVPGGIPWMIWAEMPLTPGDRSSPVVFYYWITEFTPDGQPPQPSGTFSPLPSFVGSPGESLTDFTTASLNGLVYLLWVVPSDPTKVWYSTFDGSQTTAADVLMTIEAGRTIVSIDATPVMLADADGGQPAIAVVVLSTDFMVVPRLDCILVDPSTKAAPQSVPMPVAILGSTPQSSIRATWGSLPQTDGAAVGNGLILHYVAAGLNHVIFVDDLGTYAGPTYLNVIELTPGKGYPDQGWTEVTPSLSPVNFPVASMSALFPITLIDPASNNGSISVGIAGELLGVSNLDEQYLFYLQTLPALQLRYAQGNPVDMIAEPGLNDPTLQAVVSSWVLLGVLTGLPPYQPGQPDVSVTYGRTKSSTQGTTLTSGHTITAGATLFSTSFSTTIDASDAVMQETDFELDISLPLSNAAPATHGWLFVVEPSYRQDTFEVLNADGKDSGITVTMLTIVATNDVKAVPFLLTTPNTPVDDAAPFLRFACHFPTGANGEPLVTWPASDDMDGWMALPSSGPAFAQWMQALMLEELSHQPAPINVGDNGYDETLTLGTSRTTTLTSTLTLSGGPDVELPLLKFNVSGELSMAVEVSTSFQEAEHFTISYGPLIGRMSELVIMPYLFQATGDAAPWVPELFAQQRPWLLTWRILAFD